MGYIAEQSFSVGEKLQAPVCSSDQLDMLSCRDGAMQHCQQAPVSNEFSTAVLADSIAVQSVGGVQADDGGDCRGEKSSLFSITVAPGVRHGHSSRASSGVPFPPL